jgi:hypothetical protein
MAGQGGLPSRESVMPTRGNRFAVELLPDHSVGLLAETRGTHGYSWGTLRVGKGQGVSFSITKLDAELKKLWDLPCESVGYTKL